MKHKQDFKALEKHRLQRANLLARRLSKSEVVRQLGVTRQTVTAWEQRLTAGGREALKRGDLGRPHLLDMEQSDKYSVVGHNHHIYRNCYQAY